MRRLLTLLLLGLTLPVHAGELRLHSTPEIEQLLAPYLPDEAGGRRRQQRQIGEILATEGYFSPQFDFSEEGELTHLRLDPGPRTRVVALDLAVDGPLEGKTRAELLADWALPVGLFFRQESWNEAKQQVLNRLLSQEHADARLLDSRADIDADSNEARLLAHYDAGPRYRFGELQFAGFEIHQPALIERYNRSVRYGEPYAEDALNRLQTVLRATPFFSAVQTRLLREAASDNPDGTRTAPVLVEVRERNPQRLGFGGGFSTNTGGRVEASYQNVNFLDRSWELASGLRLEQKKQTAYGDVFLPPDGRFRSNSFGAMSETADIQGLRSNRYAFGVQSVQQRGSVEQRLSLHWEREELTPTEAATTLSRALVPNAMWTWRAVDDLLAPRAGSVAQAQIGGASRHLLADRDFLRLHTRLQHYLPLGRRDSLSLRAEFGRTFASGRDHIPQDYLFRAGGSGSVRGYAYQSLGLKEGAATLGGRYLAILSAEATHWLDEHWGIAAFVDAGDAVDSLKDSRLAVGYGLGARWRSPAGPLGVDLAYGQRTGELQLHFSLAIPF